MGWEEAGAGPHERSGRGPSLVDRWRKLQERGRANQRRLHADIARSRRITAALTIPVILLFVLVAKAGDFAFGHQTPVLVTLFVVGVVAVSAMAVRHALMRRREPQGDGDLHR